MKHIKKSEMTTNRLKTTILKWEEEQAESFADYFLHDNVEDSSWSNFLKKTGHTEKAKSIDAEIEANGGKPIYDQEFLYNVYPLYVDDKFSEENNNKNVLLWSEFIASDPSFLKKAEEFLNQ